jgi:hypothetical protein
MVYLGMGVGGLTTALDLEDGLALLADSYGRGSEGLASH